MIEKHESRRVAPFKIIVAVAISLAVPAQAQEILARLDDATPAEVRIVSTEFKYTPARVRVTPGREFTLVLDNSGAETEHGIFVPALGFRLEAKAGQIARKKTVFAKPGEYEFVCNLPGHLEAGMKGTLIVVDR
jgi:uncharacterized cupredoxin-like copper-binding protein